MLQDVRRTSVLRRPKRSGDLGPMGRLPRNNRSHAEDGLQDVRGTSVLQRPKRSGDRVRSGGPHATSRPSRRRDLEPWCSCPTTTEVLRKMGCKTSGGRLFCNDRSGAETLDPWGQGPLPLLKLKRAKP